VFKSIIYGESHPWSWQSHSIKWNHHGSWTRCNGIICEHKQFLVLFCVVNQSSKFELISIISWVGYCVLNDWPFILLVLLSESLPPFGFTVHREKPGFLLSKQVRFWTLTSLIRSTRFNRNKFRYQEIKIFLSRKNRDQKTMTQKKLTLSWIIVW
jgi:hypothetical protein